LEMMMMMRRFCNSRMVSPFDRSSLVLQDFLFLFLLLG